MSECAREGLGIGGGSTVFSIDTFDTPFRCAGLADGKARNVLKRWRCRGWAGGGQNHFEELSLPDGMIEVRKERVNQLRHLRMCERDRVSDREHVQHLRRQRERAGERVLAVL